MVGRRPAGRQAVGKIRYWRSGTHGVSDIVDDGGFQEPEFSVERGADLVGPPVGVFDQAEQPRHPGMSRCQGRVERKPGRDHRSANRHAGFHPDADRFHTGAEAEAPDPHLLVLDVLAEPGGLGVCEVRGGRVGAASGQGGDGDEDGGATQRGPAAFGYLTVRHSAPSHQRQSDTALKNQRRPARVEQAAVEGVFARAQGVSACFGCNLAAQSPVLKSVKSTCPFHGIAFMTNAAFGV